MLAPVPDQPEWFQPEQFRREWIQPEWVQQEPATQTPEQLTLDRQEQSAPSHRVRGLPNRTVPALQARSTRPDHWVPLSFRCRART